MHFRPDAYGEATGVRRVAQAANLPSDSHLDGVHVRAVLNEAFQYIVFVDQGGNELTNVKPLT